MWEMAFIVNNTAIVSRNGMTRCDAINRINLLENENIYKQSQLSVGNFNILIYRCLLQESFLLFNNNNNQKFYFLIFSLKKKL